MQIPIGFQIETELLPKVSAEGGIVEFRTFQNE
jgi:hypothetical protein